MSDTTPEPASPAPVSPAGTPANVPAQDRVFLAVVDKSEEHRVALRYAALRASRLQLQPPPGSQRTVRFLQCQAY